MNSTPEEPEAVDMSVPWHLADMRDANFADLTTVKADVVPEPTEPAFDVATALTELREDFRDCRKAAREVMPDKHAETVDEAIKVGRLLGQRGAFTYAIGQLDLLLSRTEQGSAT